MPKAGAMWGKLIGGDTGAEANDPHSAESEYVVGRIEHTSTPVANDPARSRAAG